MSFLDVTGKFSYWKMLSNYDHHQGIILLFVNSIQLTIVICKKNKEREREKERDRVSFQVFSNNIFNTQVNLI